MLKLSLSLILLSTSLTSCAFPELDNPIERCSMFLEEVADNVYTGKCRCHLFEVTEDHIGRVGESYDESLAYCDRGIIFRSESYLELTAWWKALMEYKGRIQNARSNRFKKQFDRFE